ncbi:hypothetical protein Q7P37_002292 [Cladosporium fusiforme]
MPLQTALASPLIVANSGSVTSPDDTSVALGLAAAYHRDLQLCKDDNQVKRLCLMYRDRIIGISRLADVLAAAFNDAFPSRLQQHGQGDDLSAWSEFASLAKRVRTSNNREAQKLQHQTCIIALWGEQVFQHYSWRELPLEYTRLLHKVACGLPKWADAVEMLNTVMLERHKRRVIDHNNKSLLIGEHSRGSKIQSPRSPVQRQDINLILKRMSNKSSPVAVQVRPGQQPHGVVAKSIQSYGLEHDHFGMIVPQSAPGVIRDTESPSSRACKRQKLQDPAGETACNSPRVTRRPQQPTPVSTSSTDSELTDAEGDSYEEYGGSRSSHWEVTIKSPKMTSTLLADGSVHQELGSAVDLASTLDNQRIFDRQLRSCHAQTGVHDKLNEADDLLTADSCSDLQTLVAASDNGDFVDDCSEADLPQEGSDRGIPERCREAEGEETRATPEVSFDDYSFDFDLWLPEFHEDTQERVAHSKLSGTIVAPKQHTPATIPSSPRLLVRPGHSVSAHNGQLSPDPTKLTGIRYCTDVQPSHDESIVGRMACHYSGHLRDELQRSRAQGEDAGSQRQNRCKIDWLQFTQWANVHISSRETSEHDSALAAAADVLHMDWETFKIRAAAGEAFSKPILIQQEFQDSGMYDVRGYVDLLKERFHGQNIDVQDCDTGECQNIPINQFCTTASADNEDSAVNSSSMSNAINLRRFANADAPLLTRLKRFRLLETLIERASKQLPGKRSMREVNDIADCIGFNLLGFKGAFSRPHVDALSGTWVRCLSGAKAWIFAPNMCTDDWEAFARDGPSWSPAGKGRVIILEKDDVLLMPPGVRTLHSVLTLEDSLMEGGMLWDEHNIPALLDELLWVAQHQLCTNEPIAYQLPKIIDELECWAREQGNETPDRISSPEHVHLINSGVETLRGLGCKCGRICKSADTCQCIALARRCTAWCLKHPAFHLKDKKSHRCMLEN